MQEMFEVIADGIERHVYQSLSKRVNQCAKT